MSEWPWWDKGMTPLASALDAWMRLAPPDSRLRDFGPGWKRARAEWLAFHRSDFTIMDQLVPNPLLAFVMFCHNSLPSNMTPWQVEAQVALEKDEP